MYFSVLTVESTVRTQCSVFRALRLFLCVLHWFCHTWRSSHSWSWRHFVFWFITFVSAPYRQLKKIICTVTVEWQRSVQYLFSKQWICFLRMHAVCLHEYQHMAGIFVVEVKTYRKKERRFTFVDIGNGRGWGNSRPVSLSLSGYSEQCLSSRSLFWFGLWSCLGNQLHSSTLYPLHVYPNSFS